MNMRKACREIARRYHVPIEEVRAQMQKAIDMAWNNPDKTAAEAALQSKVPTAGEVPTPEEVMRYAMRATGRRRASELP